MLHSIKAKLFKKYDLPKKPLPQYWQDVMTLVDQQKVKEIADLYANSHYQSRLNILKTLTDMEDFNQFEDYCEQHLECSAHKNIYHLFLIKTYQAQLDRAKVSKKKEHKLHDTNYYSKRVQDCLNTLLQVNHSDKHINKTLIEYSLNDQLPSLDIEQCYLHGIELEGSNLPLNILMLKTKHCDQLIDFANQIIKSDISSQQPENLALIGVTHYETYRGLLLNNKLPQAVNYFKTDSIKNEIIETCERFLNTATLNENTSISANSFLYFALLYQNKSLVKALLTFSDLYVDFDHNPWCYETNHLESYNKLRFFSGI
ncbi:hypothetical protein [Marinicellulosiphila megalodicopiae]|uniref:hypothetical protein n=1 Tax=Marinicellulosiphila megalodicopiae TaxID=2724896 RepID=UPI003BB0B49A